MSQSGRYTPTSGPGSGTVTSISAGTGITLTPNPITTTGTVALTIPVTVPDGGSGAISFTAHGVLLGEGTSAFGVTAVGTTGQVLTGVTGSDPIWASPAASSITITGDSGGGLTGNSFTFTGGTTGLTFAGAGSTETLGGTLVVGNGGTGAATLTGLLLGHGTSAVTAVTAGDYGVLISSSSGVPSWLANGTTGQILTATTSGTPSWENVAASSITITGDSGGGLTGASFTFTGGTTGLTFAGAGSTETLGGTLAVKNGGTGAATLTGVLIGNGTSAVTGNAVTQYDVLVGGASNAISSVGPGTALQVLQSGGNAANPAYSTATYPATTTINQLLYSSSNNVIGGVTAGDYGVLISSSSGVPSWLANGTTGQILTATTSGTPSWENAASGGISTIDGNSGSVTGSTVTVKGTVALSGESVTFTGSGTTLTLSMTDANSNTIIGANAGSGSVSGTDNVILGSTTAPNLTSGSTNTIIGCNSGAAVKLQGNNVLIGYQVANDSTYALGGSNTFVGVDIAIAGVTGTGNVAVGRSALPGDGGANSRNVILGMNAAANYSFGESDNILIGYSVYGTTSENNALHIGSGTGTGQGNLNSAYISGIQGISVTGSAVLVSSSDQLGVTVSSGRYKENIEDMDDVSDAILDLRPVTFTYKVGDDQSQQVGLIAEEVHEIMPSLVVLDKEGLPQTVKYHELPVLLLNELQKALHRIEMLEDELVELREMMEDRDGK